MKEQLKKRIADFWDGRLDTVQQKRLLSDLENDDGDLRTQLKHEFQKGDEDKADRLADADAQSILEVLHRKMGLVTALPVKRRLKTYWMIAVVMLAVVGFGLSIMRWRSSAPVAHDINGNFLVAEDTVRLINRNATSRKTQLPDGSTVILSPGSELVFIKSTVKNDRVFHLRGQGQFQVAHDPLHPFVVWANGFTTTAVGTAFAINAHASEKIEVELLSGKIIVKSTARSAMQIADQYLMPGDKLRIDPQVQSLTLNGTSATISGSATHTKVMKVQKHDLPFVFVETPLTEVFADIASRKHVQIVIDSLDLKGLSFTGEFSNTEPTLTMIQIVCQMNNLDYIEQENQIIIKHEEHIDTVSPIEEKSDTPN
ncbi:FecR family protein [Sphingobacterium paludis]|uniref:FecR family protein n=1 Tax=Sphingobacterium paludis TaxID=1476465 RepID=A0A4R7CTN6_9SPHI|nr:FecR domain-containing protein [Sphingobacterium paludis]TDS09755.1 FecR family protein [Sphingobacterium paludis]